MDLEQGCADVEAAAEVARRSASGVVAVARALKKAAEQGNVAAIKRCQRRLEEALGAAQGDVMKACGVWGHSDADEQAMFGAGYVERLKAEAETVGLQIFERDEVLFCYPSIVRVLAGERALRVDRRKVSTARPSFLARLLLANQKRSSGFSSQRFLESLYAVYADIVSAGSSDGGESGRVVRLARLYGLMTSLPGSARDYDRSDFARDIYMLDSDGPTVTRKGFAVSFPSSTGARVRSSDLFSFVGPTGDAVDYYGIRFSKAAQ